MSLRSEVSLYIIHYSYVCVYSDSSVELNIVFLFLVVKVTDISESVFNKVPRKSHLNSGFSITEMTSQGGQVYNLLAEVSA